MKGKNRKKVSAIGTGTLVKVRYLGLNKEPKCYVGAATRTEYWFGGMYNLGEVDNRDLTTGQSFAPGLLEMTSIGCAKLFEVYTSHTETEAEPVEHQRQLQRRPKARAAARTGVEDTDASDTLSANPSTDAET